MGYVGSIGGYYLFNEVLKCINKLIEMNIDFHLLIINRGQHTLVKQQMSEAGIPNSKFKLISSSYAEMPKLISTIDIAIYFIKPVYSKLASSPTKLAEFLACGVPCLSNSGVGDMNQIFENQDIGVVLNSFEEAEIQKALEKILYLSRLHETSSKCVAAAARYFSLEDGANKYNSIYEALSY